MKTTNTHKSASRWLMIGLLPVLGTLAACASSDPEIEMGTALADAKKAQQAQMEQDDTSVTARETVKAIQTHMQGGRELSSQGSLTSGTSSSGGSQPR